MAGKEKKKITESSADTTRKSGITDMTSGIPAWAPLVIMLLTALLYAHALQNQLTSFDDDFYITRNPYLRDFSWHGVKAIFSSFYSSNYHPLTTLTFLLEYHNFGVDPFPYHLANVALHVLNTFLVYKVTETLSGKRLTAVIVSVLFAVHPMHVESVAWVAERKDVLYAFFFLSSLWAYLHYISGDKKTLYYPLAFVLFLLSAMSKSTAVTLPVVFIIVDIYKDRKITAATLLEKVPFLALSLLFGVLNIMAQAAGGSINSIAASLGLGNRLFLVTSAISSYLFRAVVSYRLCGIHYFPVLDSHGMLPFYYYLSIFLVAGLVWLITRKSMYRKEILFGSAFFLVTIALMLQVVSVGSALVAERYTYIAYIGPFYILGQWVSSAGAAKWRKALLGALAGVSLIFCAISWERIAIWKNDIILFGDMIEKYPDVYFGYWMMGNFEKGEGNLNAALENYNKSISLNATNDDAYYNRAKIYDAMGDVKSAMSDYTTCIAINKTSADAFNNRGWDRFTMGDTANALRDIDSAIMIKPDYFEAYNNRGWITYSSGITRKSIADFNKALFLAPSFDRARYNRAAAYGASGMPGAARLDYDTLISYDPKNGKAYFFRGVTKLQEKDTAAARADFQSSANYGFEPAKQMLRQIH